MSEWLTTEQMIVKMVQLDPFTVFKSEEGETVAKNRYGSIRYCDSHGNTSGETVQLNFEFMRKKWRILPRYVSFEEAMKAFEKGKKVYFHGVGDYKLDEGVELPPKGINISNSPFNEWNPYSLYIGKWTIED
jgi:hypothetical protein